MWRVWGESFESCGLLVLAVRKSYGAADMNFRMGWLQVVLESVPLWDDALDLYG